MTGRKQELNLQFRQIVDGILLVVAFWIAYVARNLLQYYTPIDRLIPPFSDFRWLVFLIMPFGPIMLELQGYYSMTLQKSLWKSLNQMVRAGVWMGLLVGGCVVFLKLQVPSRIVAFLYIFIAAALLVAREQLTLLYMKRRAASGAFREPVLLVGLPMDTRQFRESFTQDMEMEMEVVGEIDIEKEPISALVESLHRHSVSRVLFAGGHTQMNRIQEGIAACEIEGVEAWLLADFIKTSIARPDFDVLGSNPMLVFRTTADLSWALLVKGGVDRVCALILLVLSAPLLAVAAIGIRLTSPGPVIFRQQRAGRHGKPFVMLKFRSMHTDAEMQRVELERLNQMSGPVFKLREDPRITRFGRWLRMTSIDELPQLVNVLRGDMSLVGPRPLPVYEVEKFENTAQRRRLSVKPGLTCLWQVSGRSEVRDFQEWVKLDLDYIDNWSLWLDLKILLRTVPVVLLGLGAR
jgi:exopolysaccharide biosynthesis polyprenyl glycosylphosphotransferase